MTDAILIVGGGIAGLHAALQCADAGARVTVVEQGPVVGGRLAAPMTRATAIGNRAEGLEIPLFAALADNENIDILTQATLERISGGPGNFDATIRERARFVTDACTRCKLCHTVCPVVRSNDYDAGLTFRKAIYTPIAETLPAPYVIDIDSCLNTPPNYLPCNRCVEVCDDNAIFFDLPLQTLHERHVGAIILAPGFKIEDSAAYAELGYGAHPDIVTSAELQRLLESPGPTGGYASRPSNEDYPDSVLLVLDQLSRFAFYIVASQVRQLLEQDIDNVSILVLSQPNSDNACVEAKQFADAAGITLQWGTKFAVDETNDTDVSVSFEEFTAQRFVKESYNMVVLCTDVEPPDGLVELARTADVELADNGYIRATEYNGVAIATSRPGIFVAGCASGAKNIRDSIFDAQEGAAAALTELDPRLLNGEVSSTAVTEQAKAATPDASADLQGQIESALYALLDQPSEQGDG